MITSSSAYTVSVVVMFILLLSCILDSTTFSASSIASSSSSSSSSSAVFAYARRHGIASSRKIEFTKCCNDPSNLLDCTKRLVSRNKLPNDSGSGSIIQDDRIDSNDIARIAILSHSSSNMQDFFRYSLFINAVYSEQNGYSMIVPDPDSKSLFSAVHDESSYDGRWIKVTEVKRFLDSALVARSPRATSTSSNSANEGSNINGDSSAAIIFDYLVWIDADFIFVDLDFKIESIIKKYPDADMILCEDPIPDWADNYANTGMMIIKISDWSRAFVDHWWGHNEIRHMELVRLYQSQVGDQSHFNVMFKENRYAAKDHIVVLPFKTFNSPSVSWMSFSEENRVLHLMGEDSSVRAALLTYAFNNMCSYLSVEKSPLTTTAPMSAATTRTIMAEKAKLDDESPHELEVEIDEEDFYNDENFAIMKQSITTMQPTDATKVFSLSRHTLIKLARSAYFQEIAAINRIYGSILNMATSFEFTNNDVATSLAFYRKTQTWGLRLYCIFVFEHYAEADDKPDVWLSISQSLTRYELKPFRVNQDELAKNSQAYILGLKEYCQLMSHSLEILLSIFQYFQKSPRLISDAQWPRVLVTIVGASLYVSKCPVDFINSEIRRKIVTSLIQVEMKMDSLRNKKRSTLAGSLLESEMPSSYAEVINDSTYLILLGNVMNVFKLVAAMGRIDDDKALGQIKLLAKKMYELKPANSLIKEGFYDDIFLQKEQSLFFEGRQPSSTPLRGSAAFIGGDSSSSSSISSSSGTGSTNLNNNDCAIQLDIAYESIRDSLFSFDTPFPTYAKLKIANELLISCQARDAFKHSSSNSASQVDNLEYLKYQFQLAFLNASYYKIYGFIEEFISAYDHLESLLRTNEWLAPFNSPIADIKTLKLYSNRARSSNDIIAGSINPTPSTDGSYDIKKYNTDSDGDGGNADKFEDVDVEMHSLPKKSNRDRKISNRRKSKSKNKQHSNIDNADRHEAKGEGEGSRKEKEREKEEIKRRLWQSKSDDEDDSEDLVLTLK